MGGGPPICDHESSIFPGPDIGLCTFSEGAKVCEISDNFKFAAVLCVDGHGICDVKHHALGFLGINF